MAEKGKARGAGSKSKREKSRTPVKDKARYSKTSKTSGRTSPRDETPAPEPIEPLDAEPILDDLLERVIAECTLRAVRRKRVPFAVSRARDAILFVAEWRFLVRDNGDPAPEGERDPERDGVWSEDEEPQSCCWDSWTPGVVPIVDGSLLSKQVPSENVPVTAEAEGPLVCPGDVPDAVPVLDVPLPPDQVPAAEPPCQALPAAAAAPPAQVPDAVTATEPEPSRPEPPTAPPIPGKGRSLARRPKPRPAPPGPPQTPALHPAKPSEPPARAPPESREATAEVSDQVSPSSVSSRPSVASIPQRRPSRGTGVPRLGARRLPTRWVLPEVKVVDVTTEPERARPGAGRARQIPPGSHPSLPAAGRARKAEPQLCDPWLASARLAPGVTVRWGSSERRGPHTAGHGGHGDGEKEDEALRKAEEELQPILPFPLCRLSDYGE